MASQEKADSTGDLRTDFGIVRSRGHTPKHVLVQSSPAEAHELMGCQFGISCTDPFHLHRMLDAHGQTLDLHLGPGSVKGLTDLGKATRFGNHNTIQGNRLRSADQFEHAFADMGQDRPKRRIEFGIKGQVAVVIFGGVANHLAEQVGLGLEIEIEGCLRPADRRGNGGHRRGSIAMNKKDLPRDINNRFTAAITSGLQRCLSHFLTEPYGFHLTV